MTVKVWSNVQIAVQSALSASSTITGITKANPAVVTYSGSDLAANADFIVLSVQGMYQLDQRILRVANVNTTSNTLELEGVDSTLFDTFTSGSFTVVTFGTTLSVISDVNVSGGDFQMIDVTTIHDNVKKEIPGTASPVSISMTANWDPSDAGLVALKAASDARDLRAVKVTFADGAKWVFTGYIGATLSPTGSAQNKVSTPITISAYGKPSAYAS